MKTRHLLPLVLLVLAGCNTSQFDVTAPTDYDRYPVFLGKPMALGGKPIAVHETGEWYQREAFHANLGSSSTQRTGLYEETVTTVTESTRARTGQGTAKTGQFVAEARIYCGRYICAPGAIIIPVVYAKVYGGVEGKVVQPAVKSRGKK